MSKDQFGSGTSAEVAIIGGGVIGLSIAHSLARRGVSDVLIIEKNSAGREASWAAGGILAPQIEANRADDFFRLACASRDMYRQFAADLATQTDTDIELDTTGTMYVAFDKVGESELRGRMEWQRNEGLSVEWLSREDALKLEPALSPNVRCALRFPNDYQVENRKLMAALKLATQRSGVRLIEHCAAIQIQVEAGRVVGIETTSGLLKSRTVVVAAGAWSSLVTLRPPARAEIPIEPIRGQMVCFNAPQVPRHLIYSSRGYLVPRRDGRMLAGSTSEAVGFEKHVTQAAVDAIKSMAFEIAPSLESFPIIDSWAGLRPRAADDLPVLGAADGIEDLFYATGHYRNGILLAPITGELMARAILGERDPIPLVWSPKRFGKAVQVS